MGGRRKNWALKASASNSLGDWESLSNILEGEDKFTDKEDDGEDDEER